MEDEIKALIEAGADGQTIADYMNAQHAMQSGAVAERGPHPIIDRRQAAGLVAADAMTAGTWPYIGAGIQGLTGHKADVPYEDRRRDIQRQTELARQQHPAMSEALDWVAPAVAGGLPATRARTLTGAATRAAAGSGAYGAVKGYAAPIEPDSTDVAARLPGAGYDALTNALMSYGATRGTGEAYKRVTGALDERKGRRAAQAAQQQAEAEAKARKRSEAAQKGAQV